MSVSNDLIWENVIRTSEKIVKFFGENCEVVVHDFEDLSSSAIHVAGNVTNRYNPNRRYCLGRQYCILYRAPPIMVSAIGGSR